jgi:hypothetical protein
MEYVKKAIKGREGDSLSPIVIHLKDTETGNYLDLADYTAYISVNNCENLVIKEYFNLQKITVDEKDAFVWSFPVELDIPSGKYQWFLKLVHPNEGEKTSLYGDFIVEQRKVFEP